MIGNAARVQLTFKQWIETKAAPVASVGVLVALVIRASQVYSFGAFSFAALPPALQSLINIVTGVCIALGAELLMSAAGAQWFRLRQEAIALQFDETISRKKDREAQAAARRADARVYLWFTLLGGVASVGASLYFAFTATHNAPLTAILADVLVSLVIAGCVFFFGVVYEPPTVDASKAAQGALDAHLFDSAASIAGKIAAGTVTPEELSFLAAQASPKMARQLRSLMPRDDGIEWFDTPKIAAFLGCESDETRVRAIRRILATAAKNGGASGIRQKATGRGLEVSQSVFMGLFGDEIAARIKGAVAASDRTLNGQSTAPAPGVLRLAAASDGQRADAPRRVGVVEA